MCMVKLSRRKALSAFSFIGLGAGLVLFSSCDRRKLGKDVLSVALAGSPDSLSPLKAEFAVSALLFRQFMLPLVAYGENNSNKPAIAKSWQASPDYKIWSFEIASGLKWSDNSPINAEDVFNTFRICADPKAAFPDASEYFSIKGFKDAIINNSGFDKVGIKKDGDRIIIELDAPDANFPARLREFYPISKNAYEKYKDNWANIENIVVSGPFIPTKFTQTELIFKNNQLGGWNDKMPRLINVLAVEDGATRIRLYQSGEVDLAQDPPLLRYGLLNQKYGDLFARVPMPRMVYISFNTKKESLKNKEIRQALAMSFNRKIIAHNIMRDAVHSASRILRDEPYIEANIEKAKALMAKNGYGSNNPLKIELLVGSDEKQKAAIQIANSWKDICVEANISGGDNSAISARLNGHDFDVAIVKIDKGLKQDPLDLLASFATGGNAYSHQWQNKAFDEAIAKARAISQPNERKKQTILAEHFLLDECPISPIWFMDSAWLKSERVQGGINGLPPIIFASLTLK